MGLFRLIFTHFDLSRQDVKHAHELQVRKNKGGKHEKAKNQQPHASNASKKMLAKESA